MGARGPPKLIVEGWSELPSGQIVATAHPVEFVTARQLRDNSPDLDWSRFLELVDDLVNTDDIQAHLEARRHVRDYLTAQLVEDGGRRD